MPPSELFVAVVAEVGRLLGADLAGMIHYGDEGTISPVATWAAVGEHPEVGGRWSLEGDRLATTISRTGRPAREDDWDEVSGPIAAFVREQLGINSSVGSPVIVEGRVWGALFVHSTSGDALPAGTEARLTGFTELVATAISNSEARAEVERLADEQAGLRRVATLVARASPPAEVFAAVGEEVRRLLRMEETAILRYEDDGTATDRRELERGRTFGSATACPLKGRASLRACSGPGVPPVSTTTRWPAVPSGPRCAKRASARRSALRSWSREGFGG